MSLSDARHDCGDVPLRKVVHCSRSKQTRPSPAATASGGLAGLQSMQEVEEGEGMGDKGVAKAASRAACLLALEVGLLGGSKHK